MTTTAVEDTMLDEAWLAAPRKRSRLTAVMVAALIASVCFLGGSLAQKHLGGDSAAASGASGLPTGLPDGFTGAPGGLPSGGLPGATQQGSATPSTGTQGDGEEQVIGTVIEKNGDVWLVEDLGGNRHEVSVAEDTKVIREVTLTPAKVKTGDRVQVTGVERDDRLQAADITLR